MSMLLRVGVSASNGARMSINLWRGLASRLQRRTLATAEELAAWRWNPEESETNSFDTSSKRAAKDCPSPIAANTTRASKKDSDCSKPTYGPFPSYSHPGIYSSDWLPIDNQHYIEESPELKRITFWRNENVAVVYDHMPQSTIHLVALSLRYSIGKLSELTKEHVPHLKEMAAIAESIISSQSKNEKLAQVGFQYGFHSIAVMQNLALHIVSRDFMSDKILRKRQWNLFNTEFFIPARTFISTLERDGKLSLLSKRKYTEMLKQDMHCRRCNKLLKHMPMVWQHTADCKAPPQPLE